jgi:hypothetical protein
LAIAFGVGALLALERHRGTWDAVACALLCLGVATYSFTLPFVLGAAVLILRGPGNWKRLWVAAIPAAIYCVWWLHARGFDHGPTDSADLANLLLLPAWAFQSLATALGAMTGLDFHFVDGAAEAGGAMALVALGALAWRLLHRPSAPLLATTAVVLGFWALGVITQSPVRTPIAGRYLLPVIVCVALIGAAAIAGNRWRREAVIVAIVVALAGLAVNVKQLANGGDSLRDAATVTRAQLGAVQVAGGAADQGYDVYTGRPYVMEVGFSTLGHQGREPVRGYLSAVDAYGPLGYDEAELAEQSEDTRALIDETLVDVERLALAPVDGAAPGRCTSVENGAVPVEPGGTVTIEAADRSVPIAIRRFASATAGELGVVPANSSSRLALPADQSAVPWTLAVAGSARVCVA